MIVKRKIATYSKNLGKIIFKEVATFPLTRILSRVKITTMRYYFWRFIHHGIAHQFYWAVGERQWVDRFHDWTGERVNRYAEIKREQ